MGRDDIATRLRSLAEPGTSFDDVGGRSVLEDAAGEVERLRVENIKQARQILDAAHLLLGVPVGTPAFEAHRILCGMPLPEPPEVK